MALAETPGDIGARPVDRPAKSVEIAFLPKSTATAIERAATGRADKSTARIIVGVGGHRSFNIGTGVGEFTGLANGFADRRIAAAWDMEFQ